MGYFDCWEWEADCTAAGYGMITTKQQHRYVHRLAYEELVGPIPAGHLIHHTCCNRACYNPAHLALCTNATHPDNRPGKERAKTHCVNGHVFDDENTYVQRNGHRKCRRCNREYMRRRQLAAA